jgi:hypothetical protein
LLFNSCETEGEMDRVQLKEAILDNLDHFEFIAEHYGTKKNAMISQVMKTLKADTKGRIKKRDFKKALFIYN